MFLTITSTTTDAATATDLGYLLHKHPDRVQQFTLPVGTAHVFYPEATARRCTAALLLEVDPVGLVRNKKFGGADGFALAQYVNDRPYAASSMLAVALGRVFGTALKGRCAARPELEGQLLSLTIQIPAVPVHGGRELVERLFRPLGWQVEATVEPLDPTLPAWGDSPYQNLTLTGELTLAAALGHLYVLLPVLDGAKHYWVGSDEVAKLIRSGGDWLGGHPERDLITRRYLAHQRSFVDDATRRLAELDDQQEGPDDAVDDAVDDAADDAADDAVDDAVDDDGTVDDGTDGVRPRPLVQYRKAAVVQALKDAGAQRVVDLGCGEGALLRVLLADPDFTEILGVDVSAMELGRAQRRLRLDRLPDSVRARITLRQSSATYRDAALAGFDAVVLMEVVEHVDPDRLPALERSVFAAARPASVVVTTPNCEYNPLYEHLPAGTMRHRDHRFEWTREEFRSWVDGICVAYGYDAEIRPVGEPDPERGAPTQLALFTRARPEGGVR